MLIAANEDEFENPTMHSPGKTGIKKCGAARSTCLSFSPRPLGDIEVGSAVSVVSLAQNLLPKSQAGNGTGCGWPMIGEAKASIATNSLVQLVIIVSFDYVLYAEPLPEDVQFRELLGIQAS